MSEENNQNRQAPDPKNPPEPVTPMPGLPAPNLSSQTIEELDTSQEQESLRKIEAALFIAGKYLSIPELIALTDINPILLKELIKKLSESYSFKESSLEIIEKSGSFKMDVKPDYINMINKLATGNSEFTKAEQETLAIIAYKQPIKQSVIIKIRGNKAYDHVRKFTQLGLVKGKRLGHTKELTLSQDFYDYFHLRNQEISDDHRNSEAYEEFRDLDENKQELNLNKINSEKKDG